MAESSESDEMFWVDPEQRGILRLESVHIPRRLARTFRSRTFQISINTSFAEVVDACRNRDETWINDEIAELYQSLFRSGYAHSVEIRDGGEMFGGLYGVALGGAFFGESMFSTQTDGSKLALVALIARLISGGYKLLDTQFITDHLTRFGAVEIPRAKYHRMLSGALRENADFYRLPQSTDHRQLLQLITQTS